MNKLKINTEGQQSRKDLTYKIGELVGVAPTYTGAGGNVLEGERFRFSYVVMNITIAQDCTIIWDERTDAETMNNVFDGLEQAGYEFERPTLETAGATDEAKPATKPDKRDLPRLYTLNTPRGEIFIAEEFETRDDAATEGYGEYFSTALGTVYSYGDNHTFALVPFRKAGDWDTTTMGRDFREKAPAEPENRTYQAELSDPECPDRMEVFGAEDDEDALRQAYSYCEGEVVLLELFQLDDDYNVIRSVEITPRTDRLTIEIPLDGFTPEKLDNLIKLVNAKAPLLRVALGTDDLPIKQTNHTLQFPWFRGEGAIDSDHTNAYAALVSLLCKTAIEKKRVTAKEKDAPDNPKYAMRCFLLSLGFIGDEYKAARKILLSRLEGNSSWKNGKKAETETEVVGNE